MHEHGVAPENFDGYVAHLHPVVRRLTVRRSARHPYLGSDDLMQEALLALWEVWETYRATLPTQDLYRIGYVAARHRLTDQRRRAFSFGEVTQQRVAPEDEKVLLYGGQDVSLRRQPPRPVWWTKECADFADLWGYFYTREIGAVLSQSARIVLGELLNPGLRTLRAVACLWSSPQRSSRNWRSMRVPILMRSLRWGATRVCGALAEIKNVVHAFFPVCPPGEPISLGGEIAVGETTKVKLLLCGECHHPVGVSLSQFRRLRQEKARPRCTVCGGMSVRFSRNGHEKQGEIHMDTNQTNEGMGRGAPKSLIPDPDPVPRGDTPVPPSEGGKDMSTTTAKAKASPKKKTSATPSPKKTLTLSESGDLLRKFFLQPHTVEDAVDKLGLTPGRVRQHVAYSRGVKKYAVTGRDGGPIQIVLKEEHKNSSKKPAKK